MNITTSYNGEEKIWRAPKTTRLFDEQTSLGRIALYMMRSKPVDSICQISDSEGIKLSYGKACSYAIRIALHFRKMQLTADDVIGLVTPNATLLMPTIVACWLNGTPFHAVNPVHESDVIEQLFGITKPKVVFCDGAHYEKIKSATSKLDAKIYTLFNHIKGVTKIEDLLEPTVKEYYYRPEPLKYGAKQTMAIVCSSGTSGLPKAVCISNARLAIASEFINDCSVIFSFSSADWGTGITNLLVNVLVGGTRIITTRPFAADYLLEIVRKYKVTVLGTSPMQMSTVLRHKNYTKEYMKSVRWMFMAGGHCAVATVAKIRAQLPPHCLLINTYGTSEFGGIAANFQNYEIDATGKILPNVELKIIDEETGQRVGPNESGEIFAYSKLQWLGYYGNAEATAQQLDAEGWIRTGDLGYMDDEHFLHVVGRNKDIIKYQGIQCAPRVIEEIIAELKDVADVCVFSVYDESEGDLAAAAVVKKAGSGLKERAVAEYVAREHTVKYKQLNYRVPVFFVNEIVRNSNYKVLRKEMKRICLEMEKNENE